MRQQFDLKRNAPTRRLSLEGSAWPTRESPSDDTPQVCLLYDGEQERDELLRRLEHAGLGELPRVLVDVSPGNAGGRRFWTTRRSWEAASAASGAGAAGAGAAGAVGFLGSRWALVAVAILAAGPLFLISHSAWGMIHSGRGLHLSRQPE